MQSYARLGAMIANSSLAMFGLMYLNTYSLDHGFLSETRAYMAILMGATMALVMLVFMWCMYENATANVVIVAASAPLFAGSLWLVRSQETVDDLSWMRAMILHHSIAILTSERAHISDARSCAEPPEIAPPGRRDQSTDKHPKEMP